MPSDPQTAAKPLGQSLNFLRPAPFSVLHDGDPGYWRLSDEALRDIEAIEQAGRRIASYGR